MPNSAVISETGRTQATQTLYNNVVKDAIRLLSAAGSNKTISGGAVTLTPSAGESHYQIDTESAAATDDLDTINGGSAGDIIGLIAANSARVITLRSGAGNILLRDGANITLDAVHTTMLRHNGTKWTPYGGSGGADSSNMTNKSGSTRRAGDVVVFDTDNDTAFETTTYKHDLRVCGVVRSEIANNAAGQVQTQAGRIVTVNCDTAAVARGQFLVSSTTAGRATGGSYVREHSAFAIALSSKAGGSNGTVQAMLIDNFRQAIIGTSGWNMGGGTTTTSQKFTIATETWATVAGAALPANRLLLSGMGYGTQAAFATHGTPTGNDADGQSSRYKITYSTETSSTLTASSQSSIRYRSGVNFASKGFIAGGVSTSATVLNTSRKTTFSTDAESAGNTMTTSRRSQGGVSDGTNCFVGGGTSTVTDQLDNATETFSSAAGAALGTFNDEYIFLSFPASAGYRVYNNGAGTSYSRKLTFATATDANNASSASGNIGSGSQVTDGVALAYASGTAAANKLAASTGTYSSISNYPSFTSGAAASYAAL
jgi:hypothetical protein